MRLALYIKKRSLSGDTRIDALRGALKDGGCEAMLAERTPAYTAAAD